MAAITRWDINSGVLQTWLYRKTLENFEPNLYFYQMGEKPTFEDGYNTVSWAKFTQLTVNTATATLTDWVTPTETAFNATAITATPTEYGIYVNLSSMLLDTSAINFVSGAAVEVGSNLARIVDEVVQTEVMWGSNVQYSGSATSRATVATTDTLAGADLIKAYTTLQTNNAPLIDGYYVAIVHPHVVFDLKQESAITGFIEASKYVQPEKMIKWEIGALNGVRLVVSSNVKTFTSTATVYPTLVMGRWAYWVPTLNSMQSFITPRAASDSDPLAQRVKVGAKVWFVSKRLQEDSMVRIESGTSFA